MESLRKELKEDNQKLDTKIDSLRADLTNKIDSNFKWLAGLLIAGILIPIATHFLTLP